MGLLPGQHLDIGKVDDQLGKLGKEARIAASALRFEPDSRDHVLQLADTIALDDVAVGLRTHPYDSLQCRDRQPRIPIGCGDDRHAARRDHSCNLGVQTGEIGEVLVHIDHDDDIEGIVGVRKAVDVDVRHGVAEKFRHLADSLAIDLPPAPYAARRPELVVHRAVVVVPGDEQTALAPGVAGEAHEQFDLLAFLQRFAIHL